MNPETIKKQFPEDVIEGETTFGQNRITINKTRLIDIMTWLKKTEGSAFDALMDLCGVDFLKWEKTPRFEVVYQLYSYTHHHRLEVHVPLDEEDISLPSVITVWKSADWFERETYDLFGFHFEGHPHLKRLLLFEGFQGHPLRKDYPIDQRQKIPLPEDTL